MKILLIYVIYGILGIYLGSLGYILSKEFFIILTLTTAISCLSYAEATQRKH